MKSVNTESKFIGEKLTGYGAATKVWSFEISVSPKVENIITDNCVLCYTRYGAGEYTYQRVIGVVWDKTTNIIHCLDGSMDLGIHTGHPPHLRLHCRMVWVVEIDNDKKVLRQRRGTAPTTMILPVEYRDRNPDQIPFAYMVKW